MGLPFDAVDMDSLPPEVRVLMTRIRAGETPKRNKFGAVRTEYNGVNYDSKAEAERAGTLDAMQASGRILWWHPKPGTFRLGCPLNVYRPDFLVVGHESVHVEDVKGVMTSKFKRDAKLWAAYGPCDLHVIFGSNVQVITPKGLKN